MRRSNQAKKEKKLTTRAVEYASRKVLTEEINDIIRDNPNISEELLKDRIADRMVEVGNGKLKEWKDLGVN